MITAQQLIDSARALVGVPYKHLGRSDSGLDCIGFVDVAANRAGLDVFRSHGIPRLARYSRRPDPRLFNLVSQHCERLDAPIPGALLLFEFDGDAYARHFALFTECQTIIHAESRMRRAVIEHGYRAHWVRWTDSVWKIPGVIY